MWYLEPDGLMNMDSLFDGDALRSAATKVRQVSVLTNLVFIILNYTRIKQFILKLAYSCCAAYGLIIYSAFHYHYYCIFLMGLLVGFNDL